MSQTSSRNGRVPIQVSQLLRALKPLNGTSCATRDKQRRLVAAVLRIIGEELFPPASRGRSGSANGTGGQDAGQERRPGEAAEPLNGQQERLRASGNGRIWGRGAGGGAAARDNDAPATGSPADHEPGLSPRLAQTLSRLLLGDSEKEIAARLGLSPHTVHVYVKTLYRKYGVSSRAELLAKWVRKM